MYHVKKFLNQLLSQNRVLSFCFDILLPRIRMSAVVVHFRE
jgi:hypothetical protein